MRLFPDKISPEQRAKNLASQVKTLQGRLAKELESKKEDVEEVKKAVQIFQDWLGGQDVRERVENYIEENKNRRA